MQDIDSEAFLAIDPSARSAGTRFALPWGMGEPSKKRHGWRDTGLEQLPASADPLLLTEERFGRIFKSSPDWIVLSTLEEGRFVDVNEAFCRITGYHREEVIGRTATGLGLWVDRRERREMVDVLRARGEIRDHEVRFRTKAGDVRTMLRSAELIRLGGETCVISVTRDVTEKRKAEEKLRLFARELERSNRELEQFSFVVSHDLQAPLLSVASYLRLVLRRCSGKVDAESESFLDTSLLVLDRMQARIRGLLEYSLVGGREREREPVDLGEILAQTVADLAESIRESGARLILGEMPVVRVDGPQLAQVFQNLIGNAIKFRGEAPPEIVLSARRDHAAWRIAVRDNGIGIPETASGKVFELFTRVDPSEGAGGEGIGLATCKKIVESHGGNLWVESEADRGSTFFFTLPDTEGPPP